jgi:FdrA protein
VSGPVVFNRVRRSFYLDSVALMRLARELAGQAGVDEAALMIGSASNKQVLADAGLLADEGRSAGADDLVIALRAAGEETGRNALAYAEGLLERPQTGADEAGTWRPKTLASAAEALGDANLALISVPGEFAADEARKALKAGLHVMLFSDNVSLDDERALKAEARQRRRLLMGPDCGTAVIGGVPLGFANALPRGDVGIVSASGTGLQEVSCLIARGGCGISHAIGVGGRDLSDSVGGIMTLEAIGTLDSDPATRRIVLISKPPDAGVADAVFARVSQSRKPFTVCFLGLETVAAPPNVRFAPTLRAAAADVVGENLTPAPPDFDAAAPSDRGWIRGLFTGGSLCAEAQVVLKAAGVPVVSNAPIPGVAASPAEGAPGHVLLDLGASEYTVGRPHPMIDPAQRNKALASAMGEREIAVVLLDVVIGYGAHEDPAGEIAATLAAPADGPPTVVASVCGTADDPQGYDHQVQILEDAGVIVARSNAEAAEIALRLATG